MRGSDPGSAREEAERLVAMALAAARLAAAGRGSAGAGPFGALGDAIFGAFGPGRHDDGPVEDTAFATGSAECCVCPVCRVIAALRDPSPEFAERLATGAGDFAAGVASLMRSFAAAAGGAGQPPRPAPARGETPPSGPHSPDDEVWRTATRAGDDSWPAAERSGTPRPAGTKPMARKVVKRAAGAAAQDGVPSASSGATPPPKKAAPRRVDGDPGGAGGGDARPGDEA